MSDTDETASVHLRNKVCRLCLEEQPKLAELENLYFDNIHFVDILKECYSIEINLNQDQLPLLICKKCLVKTLNYYTFKNNVIENEVFLQSVNLDELDMKLQAQSSYNHQLETSNADENLDNNGSEMQHDAGEESSSEGKSENKSQINEPKYNDLKPGPKINLALSENDCSLYSEKNSSDTSCSMCTSFFKIRQKKINDVCSICSHARSERGFNHKSLEIIKSYSCSACEQTFSKPSDWKAHMISHYSNKYNCLQCSKSFDSKHELVVHTYTHFYKKAEEKKKLKESKSIF